MDWILSAHPPNASLTHSGANVIRPQRLHPSPAPATSSTSFPPISFLFSISDPSTSRVLRESEAEDSDLPLPHRAAPSSPLRRPSSCPVSISVTAARTG
ncbi:hypothetical protein PIB30_040097 [Stylosanthes scabra]|uniref:Uncharacterized protein n=1 Tax=Stylosanthes scabra TaxID=79078 RepID=A0ABU6ZD74_9FABA|nr:hypothetical protein [Stylosanthes scabra]